jgi:acyl-coenzyme A thioesterase PaaI-like protein
MRGGRDKPTYGRATVTRLGKRVANVEALAWQDDPAKPISAARMNYLVVR